MTNKEQYEFEKMKVYKIAWKKLREKVKNKKIPNMTNIMNGILGELMGKFESYLTIDMTRAYWQPYSSGKGGIYVHYKDNN